MRVALLIACAFLLACGTKNESAPPEESAGKEPDHIEVDHILIGIKMPKLPGVDRTPAEAEKLANELMSQLESGDGDWASLKRRYSADPPPGGPYKMCNHGVAPAEPNEIPRGKMVPAFGDVGFKLAVGEIGLAEYDARKSPYGYHIIKRTK
jgi:hypothetical protein